MIFEGVDRVRLVVEGANYSYCQQSTIGAFGMQILTSSAQSLSSIGSRSLGRGSSVANRASPLHIFMNL